MESLKEKTARGLLWGGVSNGIQQLLNLVFGIFLARLLAQSDYGMVGMLTVFSAIGTVLQEGGFIAALNKRKNAGHADYNELLRYISCQDKKKLKGIFVVHGEEETQLHFAHTLGERGWKHVSVPAFREEVEL